LGWAVEFDPDAVKDLKKLDRPVQSRILSFLSERVAALDDPRSIGEALAGAKLGNYWKYRVGDWRIICDIQDQRIIVRVLRVGNRRDVYRQKVTPPPPAPAAPARTSARS
jgi:mRNA interferase RelE/StbE